MSRPIVFCAGCIYSKPEPNATWNLRCHHPEVNRRDSWALASGLGCGFRGSECRGEREKKSWFAVCGIKGKKWEPKEGCI